MNEEINVAEVAAEEVVEKSNGKTLIGLGVAGAVILVGGVAYKFVLKPLFKKVGAKIKAEKDNDVVDGTAKEVQ